MMNNICSLLTVRFWTNRACATYFPFTTSEKSQHDESCCRALACGFHQFQLYCWCKTFGLPSSVS